MKLKNYVSNCAIRNIKKKIVFQIV